MYVSEQRVPEDVAERAHDMARKIGLERPFRRNAGDPATNASGDLNQKAAQNPGVGER